MGIVDTGRRNLAMQVRIGMPSNVTGLIDEVITPAYATAVGLVLYATKTGISQRERFSVDKLGKFVGKFKMQGVAGKVVDVIKSFLP